ncbi:MAG: glycosyltransferase [Nanoarchaeota archaeon]
MQVLYVTHHFVPDIVAGALRAYKHSVGLAKLNHKINILTSNSGNSISAAEFPLPPACNVNKLTGFHIPYMPAGYGYIKNFVKAGLKYKNETDIVLATSPTISAVIAGYNLSKKLDKPLITEIRDPWIRDLSSKKLQSGGSHIGKNSLQGLIFRRLQRKIFEHSRKIIVTNPEIIKETKAVYPTLNENKFEVIYNSGDIQNIKAHKFNTPTIFCSGVLYRERGIDEIIKALTNSNTIELVLAGYAPEEDMRYYEKLIYDLNLIGRVHFTGVISPQEAIAMQHGADILFAGQTDPKLNYNLPSRAIEYMAAGKPILALAIKNSGLDNLITHYKCGEVVYDSKDLGTVIAILLNKKIANKLGRAGKNAVKNEFNLTTQVKKLNSVLSAAI